MPRIEKSQVKHLSTKLSLCIILFMIAPIFSSGVQLPGEHKSKASNKSKHSSNENLISVKTKTDVCIDPSVDVDLKEKFHYLPEIYNLIVHELDNNKNLDFTNQNQIKDFIKNLALELKEKKITNFYFSISPEEFIRMFKGSKLYENKILNCISSLDGLLTVFKSEVDILLNENKKVMNVPSIINSLAQAHLKIFSEHECTKFEFRREGEKIKNWSNKRI